MKIALTEAFLEDIIGLQPGLQHKWREMLTSFRKIEVKSLREQALPGWRLHKLQSSPFISLSLDMNYRVLGKIEGDTIYFHRVVKHSLADAPRINRNDNSEAPYTIKNLEISPSDIFAALVSLGLSTKRANPFKNIENEDDLLDVLTTVDEELAAYALALYETSGLVIPRTKYTLLQNDKDFEFILAMSQNEWEIYLHPSQEYLAGLPVDHRLAVNGSAGTGKTVCAWYRLLYLAQQKQTVGFVAPNPWVLKVSQQKIEELLKGSPIDCYFFVPDSATGLIQLAEEVKHIIIDEGQELTPSWYQSLGQALQQKDTGVTIFYDLNQLGANFRTGDTRRYKDRLSHWRDGLAAIPRCNFMELYINYRNSREIAQFYYQLLEKSLPQPVRTEIPIFSCGDVDIHIATDKTQIPTLITHIIRKLQADYSYDEIGTVCLDTSTKLESICQDLERFDIPTTTNLESGNKILVTRPQFIRGHERKALIVLTASHDSMTKNLGSTINSYIALSRARDRLFIIETIGM